MKVTKGLMALMLMFALASATEPLASTIYGQWLISYLQGFDQLLVSFFWKNIYYYTWLILPQWILCYYFNDLGTMLLPTTIVSAADVLIDECWKGVSQYYDATMYGGAPENLKYPYFRSFKKG